MKDNQHSTVDTVTVPNVEKLIDYRFASAALGIEEIQIPQRPTHGIEILKAYTNWRPQMPYFGKIVAILKYKGRLFSVRFHVWEEHQTANLANRITEIDELVPKIAMGHVYLDNTPTDFGQKAVWLRTPDSELDEDSLALRSVAKALKAYSVSNQMRKKFKRIYQHS